MVPIVYKTVLAQTLELHKMYTDYVVDHNVDEFDTYRQKNLLFARLKGKHVSKRNSAMRIIFYLAQQKGYDRCILTNTLKDSKHKETYHTIRTSRFTDKTKTDISNACSKYIKNCTVEVVDKHTINKHVRYYFTIHKSFKILKISYKFEDVNWSLMEYDLLTQHKDNIYINVKNHGVYITKY